jgi:regulatory protein
MSDKDEKKPATSPYQYALYLLAGQDYSEYKIRQKLRLKGHDAEAIDETLAKLKEKNYLREDEYKKLLARKLIRKGQADDMIKRRVQQENLTLESQEMDDIRAELGVSKEEAITQLVAKKMRGQVWPEEREKRQKLQQKVYRFLLSRGFSYDEAKRAVGESQSPSAD